MPEPSEDWLETEDREEPELVSCPICGESFESEKDMGEHSQDHSNTDVFNALNSRLSERIDMVSDALSKQLEASMSVIAAQREEVETPPSEEVETPPSEEEEEVLVGDEGRESRTVAHTASQTAKEFEKIGWSRDDVIKAMPGFGQFLTGVGNFVAATRGPKGSSPFEEMGKSMFTASAELNKAMFREVGKMIGRGRLGGREETEAEHE